MAEAQMVNGVAIAAYVDGVAVDSEGREVKGAPKRAKDTDPSEQPHALAQLNTEERSAAIMARAFADALHGAGAAKGSTAAKASESESEGELPTVDELESHLAGLDSLDEVKAMKRRDKRVTAAPKYEARIAELKGE